MLRLKLLAFEPVTACFGSDVKQIIRVKASNWKLYRYRDVSIGSNIISLFKSGKPVGQTKMQDNENNSALAAYSRKNSRSDWLISLPLIIPLILGSSILIGIIIILYTNEIKNSELEKARLEEQVRMDISRIKEHIIKKDYADAIRLSEKSLLIINDISKDDRLGFYELKAVLYFCQGEAKLGSGLPELLPAAEDDFSSALKFTEQITGLQIEAMLLGRGKSRLFLNKPDLALEDFNLLLGKNQNHGKAYYWRAMAKVKTGDREGAEADQKHARELGVDLERFQ